ncbi:PAS domain-containing protein [Mycolicibacterium phlei]|uniref:PAS domain-containing protein n=1 Tax=Mycolicibacterium phlei TaxID=1771 RepID=UPI0037CBFDD3
MIHDWLLVETLGGTPVVVAQGRQTVNLVALTTLLRRSPHLMAVQTAIAETVQARQGLSSITPKNDRVIRTEVVQMTDGRIHGVQVWIGPPDMEPTERPEVGPLVWDLDRGTAVGTPESLRNSGWDPTAKTLHNRTLADDLPVRDLIPSEAKVLCMAITRRPGTTICDTWELTGADGEPLQIGFVTRVVRERQEDGPTRLLCRAMSWRSAPDPAAAREDHLAQRILAGLAQPGVHRALVDPATWTVLKWLDEPATFFDWRSSMAGDRLIHPADRPEMKRIAREFSAGPVTAVLRLAGVDGAEWTPVHVTVNRVELDDGVYAGLATLRRPAAEEL